MILHSYQTNLPYPQFWCLVLGFLASQTTKLLLQASAQTQSLGTYGSMIVYVWSVVMLSYPMMLMRRRTMRGFHASFAQLSWQFFSTTPRACGSIQPQFSRKVRGTKPQTSKLQGIGIFLEEKLEGKQLKTYISCESLSTRMASNCWSWDFRSIAPCGNSVL